MSWTGLDDKKLFIEDHSKKTPSPLLPPKYGKHEEGKGDRLGVGGQQENKMRRILSQKHSNFTALNSQKGDERAEKSISDKDPKMRDSRGIIHYVLEKVGVDNSSKLGRSSAVLTKSLEKVLNSKINDSANQSENSQENEKRQILISMMNRFQLSYQKHVEYRILFSYLGEIMKMLESRTDDLRSNFKDRTEPTVQQFRKIHSVFTLVHENKREVNDSNASKQRQSMESTKDKEKKERIENRIKYDNVLETQHIEKHRERISSLLRRQAQEQPVESSQVIRVRSEDKRTRFPEALLPDKRETASKREKIM